MTKTSVRQLHKTDGTLTINDMETANTLQEFFSSIFTDEDTSTVPILPNRNNTNMMQDIIITEHEICVSMKKLKENKGQGADNIHPSVLNRCSNTLCKPLLMIYTQTFRRSTTTRMERCKCYAII